MHYPSLGRSGLQVSAIGLGTNQFGGKVDQAGVNEIIDGAIDLGVNFIDTADIYQQGRSESTLGGALKGKWGKVVLATKAYNAMGDGPNDKGVSRYHLINACLLYTSRNLCHRWMTFPLGLGTGSHQRAKQHLRLHGLGQCLRVPLHGQRKGCLLYTSRCV